MRKTGREAWGLSRGRNGFMAILDVLKSDPGYKAYVVSPLCSNQLILLCATQ